MSVIRSLLVKVGADISDLEKQMNNAQKQMKKTARDFENVGRSLSIGVTAPLLAIGTATTKMAMDAEESENLFEVSMGNMADSARRWSEDMRKNLGLNEYEVRKNVATFNVMLDSMGLATTESYSMSKGLTQLSYDMASFYNLKPEEAFQKLQAGISGEIEPLKRLGIMVNETTIKTYALKQGMIKQGETMTEQQKILARYGAIMEQTQKAQGDLARTMDSPTNKLRIMTENIKQQVIEIGQKLLPTFEKMLEYVNRAVDWFSKLTDEQIELALKIAAVAAATGPLILGIGKAISAMNTMISVARGVSAAMATLFANPVLLGLAAVAAALALIIRKQKEAEREIKEQAQETIDMLNKERDEAIKTAEESANAKIMSVEEAKYAALNAYNEEIAAIEALYLTKVQEAEAAEEEIKESLRNQLDEAKETYDKTIERIRKEYGVVEETVKSKTDIANDYYDNEISKANEAYNKKVALIDKELAKKLALTDEVSAKMIQSVQEEIDAIDEQTKAEEKALKEAADKEKEIRLQAAIDEAETLEEREEAVKEYEEFKAELAREKLLETREAQKEALRDEIEEIKTKTEEYKSAIIERAEEEKKAVKESLDEQIKNLEDKREKEIKAIQEERKEKEAAELAKYNATKESLENQLKEAENYAENIIAILDEQVTAHKAAALQEYDDLVEINNKKIKEMERLRDESIAAINAIYDAEVEKVEEQAEKDMEDADLLKKGWDWVKKGAVEGFQSQVDFFKGLEWENPFTRVKEGIDSQIEFLSGGDGGGVELVPLTEKGGTTVNVNITGNNISSEDDVNELGDKMVNYLRTAGVSR